MSKQAFYQPDISKSDQTGQDNYKETENETTPQQVCDKATVNKNENLDVTTEENTSTSSNSEVSSASKRSSEKHKKSANEDKTPMTTNVNCNLGRLVLEIVKT